VSDPDGDPMTFDVYLGSSDPPLLMSENQTGLFYQPSSPLAVDSLYYWRVVACDSNNVCTDSNDINGGVAMTFRTGDRPPLLQNFSPAYLAKKVSLTPTLSWSGSDPDPADSVTYDIYFGTSSPPPLVASNQAVTTYKPGDIQPLLTSTVYYWRVIAHDNHWPMNGSETFGPIMQFTTGNPPYITSIVIPDSNPPVQTCTQGNHCFTGDRISIRGVRFGSTQGTSELHLGTKVFGPGSLKIKSWSDSEIIFKIPDFVWAIGKTKTWDVWIVRTDTNEVSNRIPATITKD
jgi:hypothetical protein